MSSSGIAGSTSWIDRPRISSAAIPVAVSLAALACSNRKSPFSSSAQTHRAVCMCWTTWPCMRSSSTRVRRVSSSPEFRIAVLTNSAIRRVVSTASSSNACGLRARIESTPSTAPLRKSGAQISDRAQRTRQASASTRGSVAQSAAYTASSRSAATPARLAARSSRRPTCASASPQPTWKTEAEPSNHCTAAPSAPASRCARSTIVLVTARDRARARRSPAASARSRAAGRGSCADDPRCACAA